MNGFDEHVDKDSMGDILDKAVEEINACIE